MALSEEQLYQGVYNGIASNVDTNSINNNSVRRYGQYDSVTTKAYTNSQGEGLKQKIWDDDVSPEAVERANKNIHEEDAGVNITKEMNEAVNEPAKAILSIHGDIRDLQRSLEKICDVMMEFVDEHNKNYNELKNQQKDLGNRLKEVEQGNFVGIPVSDNQQESSVGRLSGYPVSDDKELNISANPDDKGVEFFAGLKDKVTKSDEEEKVLPDSDKEDSAMGRPFCKVVKGKLFERQDLCEGVDVNKYKIPLSSTYRIDYVHFFRNMHRWGAFDGFVVQLLSSNIPIVGERALLCLGNIDFAIVTIKYRRVGCDEISCMVDNIRFIPSFFKLGKIFGAKTYPEFMDAIEVTR